MVQGNDFFHFFRGGTRSKELRETHHAWKVTEALWERSPLAKRDVSELALDIVRDALAKTGRVPNIRVMAALATAAEELLGAEHIGPLEVYWNVIETDMAAAIGFRDMMQRRKRWSSNFKHSFEVMRRQIVAGFSELLFALPESCFEESADGDVFEIPLIDLLDDPARTIERMVTFPYDDDTLSLDLFRPLRTAYERNLLAASGFSPTDDPNEHMHQLVVPTAQKKMSSGELASAYLGGTPLAPLMDLPIPLALPDKTRFEHCHIIGGTGHGKTQLIQKMIHADLLRARHEKRSVVVIDSQGDLINKLLRLDLFSPGAPGNLTDRLVLIDPTDVEHPPALNLFDVHLDRLGRYSAVDRERVLNGVVELYELIFGAFLGAELTQKQGVIFKYLARLMLQIPNATIHTLMQIMEDGKPFKPYMERLEGSARYFFEEEFFHPSFAATKKQILRRLWGVLSTPTFERMLAQATCKLDMFEALNDGKIIFINTAKDLLKRDGSELLGRFFVAMIAQATLERSTLPESKRTPTFVYIDEAHEYFDDSIETILNQARKYRVGMTLAHQTLDQLSSNLRSTILANTSIKCVGGVSAKDAHALADELHTSDDFLQSMRRRGSWTEFGVWVKHVTAQAIRLSVPLGFLERQPTIDEEDFDVLISKNRVRYCGTLAEVSNLMRSARSNRESPIDAAADIAQAKAPLPEQRTVNEAPSIPGTSRERPPHVRNEQPELGKGGARHRYLQALVKELAAQEGLKATIEAATSGGQVDVLIERDGVLAAIEISVSTPIEHEIENVRKCLAAGYPRIALILSKSKTVQARYSAAIREALSADEQQRVAVLVPEEIPDYLASLSPQAATRESTVRGYKVKVSGAGTSPEEIRERREAVARVIARSLKNT